MRIAIALLVCLFAGCQAPQTSTLTSLPDDATHAYVRLPASKVTREFIATTGFDRDHQRDEIYAFGYLPRANYESAAADLGADLTLLDEQLFARHQFDLRTLEMIDAIEDRDSETEEIVEDYHNYEALTAELQDLAAQYPDLTELTSAGRSAGGRELWVMKISDNAAEDETEPELLYIANMHGDETAGRELMIYLIRQLLNEYNSNARINNVVNNAQVFIMPSMNPDGFEAARRQNRNGSDLNRNFPDFTSDPNDLPTGRQPETQAVMSLHRQHHFAFAINFHGGEVCFNMPWDTRDNGSAQTRFGDDALMNAAGRRYADSNPTMRANDGGSFDNGLTYGYEWYEVDGGMQDWAIYYSDSTHATVELSTIKYPSASALSGIWNENREALLAYLEQGLRGYNLEIVDTAGAPVSAPTVRAVSTGRTIRYQRSDVHRPSIGGQDQLQISAPGFATTTINVAPGNFTGDLRRVTLNN